MVVLTLAGVLFTSPEVTEAALARATPLDGSSDMSEDNFGSRVLLTTIPSAKGFEEFSELTRRDFEVFSLSPSTSISSSLLLFVADVSLSAFFPLTINVFTEVFSMLVGGRAVDLFRELSDAGAVITTMAVVVTGVVKETGILAVRGCEEGIAIVTCCAVGADEGGAVGVTEFVVETIDAIVTGIVGTVELAADTDIADAATVTGIMRTADDAMLAGRVVTAVADVVPVIVVTAGLETVVVVVGVTTGMVGTLVLVAVMVEAADDTTLATTEIAAGAVVTSVA